MSNLPPPPPGAPTPPPPPYGGPPQGFQPSGNPKADAKAAKAYAKASRPWFKKKRTWVLGIIGLIIVAAIASSAGSGSDDTKKDVAATDSTKAKDPGAQARSGSDLAESSGSTHDPKDDVKIDSCGLAEFGGAEAKLTVTNHSADPSTYLIEIKLESPDGKTSYGTADAFVTSLNNGQTQKETASSLDDIPAGAKFVCKIADVTRTAS